MRSVDLFFCLRIRLTISSLIERELASRADQRVLRWFGHVERMNEYRLIGRVLMAEVRGGRVRGRPRFGWWTCEGGLGQQRNDGGSCASIRERSERVESPGAISNWKSFTPPFLLGPVFFRKALPCFGGHHLERGGIPHVTWYGWDKLYKGRNDWIPRRRCQAHGLRGVC